MLFQTYEYGILVLAVLLLYWALPKQGQNLLLLTASYVFYAFVHPWLALLLAGYTLVNYFAAIGIAMRPDLRRRALMVSIVASLGVLAAFKYLGFFVESFTQVFVWFGIADNPTFLRIFLPAGISFYTFQSLAYVIDVYKGRFDARRNLLDFSLFVSFFPQLVAGPIERAAALIPQFEVRRKLRPESLRDGLFLIIWGLFKKLVIADSVAVIVDNIFLLREPSPMLLAVGVLAFGIQIFADFSGYVDIARGTAKLLGINLSVNFLDPYFATSPANFWRRWHITLSQWFRDYVYIPLGGSRNGYVKNALILMVTFLLTGLWHGAAWNFVLWGGFHGFLILVQRTAVEGRFAISTPPRVVGIVLTFVLVQFGWLLFRGGDLSILTNSISGGVKGTAVGEFRESFFLLSTVFVYSIPLWIYAIYRRQLMIISPRSTTIRRHLTAVPAQTALATLLFLGMLVLKADGKAEFIYFQF